MKKKLNEMSLSELWQLFPIQLMPHNDIWENWYNEEAAIVAGIIGDKYKYVLFHVGSTSIRGIYAKPIVDILLLTDDEDICSIAGLLGKNGWNIMIRGDDRIVLNKGYTEEGFAERVYHLHVKKFGDNKEVLFRDYMNGHPDDAKRYEELKLSLLPKYRNDRDGYTCAKTSFCNEIYEKIRINEENNCGNG